MNILILTGMPASGKSTLSSQLAKGLSYPVLEKDRIKEALFDTLGWTCYSEKRKLDHAANAALLVAVESMLKTGCSVIVDNNFDDISAQALNQLLERYDCKCLTIFLGGDADIFYRRYIDRDNAHARHLGHIVQDHFPLLPGESQDYEMTREEFAEKFEKRGMGAFRCKGDRIDIDATLPMGIDVSEIMKKIRLYFGIE